MVGRREQEDVPPEAGQDAERVVLAGIDEAGYGPLLGPLCIGVCAVSLPAAVADAAACRLPGVPDLWALFDAALTEAAQGTDRRTVVCDSKQLHDPNKLRPLEESVLTLHAALAKSVPATFRDLLEAVSLTSPKRLAALPWYAGEALAEALPIEALAEKCGMRGESLAACIAETGARLERIRVEPVEVGAFNGLLEEAATKADVEFAVIASLLARMWERFPRLRVVVDRLGARDYYAPMLEARFAGLTVEKVAEAAELPALPPLPAKSKRKSSATKKQRSGKEDEPPRYSRYRVQGPGAAELDVTFATAGERVALPVAVASLFAKYVREGCMRALNRYWQARVPNLKPTKGYVTDGRRFLADIEAALGTEATDSVRRDLVRNK